MALSRNKKSIKNNKTEIKNFWLNLPKPIIVLAPMADVTDEPFRKLIAKYSRMGKKGGGPSALWTEFVSADGLASRGKDKLMHILDYSKTEKPIVAQIFGSNPENISKAVELAEGLGFDGVDINMGCPDKSIEKQGAGAGHIKNPDRAVEVIRTAKNSAKSIPISVKTRIGYNAPDMGWIERVLAERVAVLTVHARTRKEMSLVPANWDYVKQAVELRNRISPETLIFGNGDVKNLDEAQKRIEETGADGVMIGRGIFGNPWLFDSELPKITIEEKLNVLIEHSKYFEKKLGGIKSFAVMKKHFKAYVSGWEGAKDLRIKLMEQNDAKGVAKIIKEYIKNTEKTILNSVILNA
jgi:nifR3 family TIM-barrel protein